ncbi:MAG: D-alanine--D-alanine ligase [Flavobacteriales bacterium]|nr:D-alanine--D-alanine ligase [Flavobacteriales bacterium]MCX7767398.1 D-alanine--D-alanine ligase [Flavobacteriales bacterium]MDW8410186.1 D-alanine--D-alanine ligase [Flavobacteriales bacterium]
MDNRFPLVAILCGGDTGEYDISLRSASMVMKALEDFPLCCRQVVVRGNSWQVVINDNSVPVDKNDFSYLCPESGLRYRFDVAYNVIHGSPGEDGRLQAWLDVLGIPYTGCGYRTSLITMNKYLCKMMLTGVPVALAPSRLLRKGGAVSASELLAQLGLPLFIKPNNGGSSLGTHKVKDPSQLEAALQDAFQHDSEVLCEAYMQGRELTCGVVELEGKLHPLPITEIISHREFFDYTAKYEGASHEITPAALSQAQQERIQKTACQIFRALDCHGIVRIDFILSSDDTLWFLEVNTVPGFSPQSIVPQQLRAAGFKEGDVLYKLIREALIRKKLD